MTSKRRLESLEKDLQLAEAAYEERLASALRRCSGGQWGLFGTNDASLQAHLGAKSTLHSKDARELLERGDEILEMRQRLGYVDAFALHERFLAYRKSATDPNAPGEPKLAQQFLNEISGDDSAEKKAWKKLYKAFDEWLVERFDEWDPQALLFEDNPGREYGPEVSRIMPLLRTAASPDELAIKIQAIFSEMFDEQMAGPVERYAAIAQTIFQEWRKRSEEISHG